MNHQHIFENHSVPRYQNCQTSKANCFIFNQNQSNLKQIALLSNQNHSIPAILIKQIALLSLTNIAITLAIKSY